MAASKILRYDKILLISLRISGKLNNFTNKLNEQTILVLKNVKIFKIKCKIPKTHKGNRGGKTKHQNPQKTTFKYLYGTSKDIKMCAIYHPK